MAILMSPVQAGVDRFLKNTFHGNITGLPFHAVSVNSIGDPGGYNLEIPGLALRPKKPYIFTMQQEAAIIPEPDAAGVTVAIPTYRRGEVLLRTLNLVFRLVPAPGEVIVMDQTEQHPPEVERELHSLAEAGRIRWLRFSPPSIPRAMNIGLRQARNAIVLFLDDDVEPVSGLVGAHAARYREGCAAVCGQVLQPGESPDPAVNQKARRQGLRADLDFRFCGTREDRLASVISCNLSVVREQALAIGGFDEQFIGSAYRYETDFARRLLASGNWIRFAPEAAVRHLRLTSGGTRSQGDHLAQPSPLHAVGDYYFALCHAGGMERWSYILRRPIREVCNRFHVRRPWRIPGRIAIELRALGMALRLYRQGPKREGAP